MRRDEYDCSWLLRGFELEEFGDAVREAVDDLGVGWVVEEGERAAAVANSYYGGAEHGFLKLGLTCGRGFVWEGDKVR